MKKNAYLVAILILFTIHPAFSQSVKTKDIKTPIKHEVIKSTFTAKQETLKLSTTQSVVIPDFLQLPAPVLKGTLSVEECIAKRRSIRQYQEKELTIEQISQILWAAQGITDLKDKHRSAPSAGAIYPAELYLITSSGVFNYVPDAHQLRKIASTDIRQNLSNACLGQSSVAEAGINIVISVAYGRTAWKYGEKAVRFADIEAGHIAENISLQAVSLGLGSVCIGTLNDSEIKLLLNLPSDQKPIYVIPVGYPK
ncbi:MAG: SagB/ThcOx family dehydrogenase [Elusimicrobia bacterium]|nr:SagB/ThcOx family dehydrogenase [Elusimicrobiota bacterium]